MASCTYTVPDLAASGDVLYGPRICNQPFIDWAWDAFDFDKEDWDEGFGWDSACDITQPLARTFSGIWCLTYSAADYGNESYDADILHWGCRYARTHIDELDGRCGDGSAYARTHSGGLFVDEWTRLFLGFFYAIPVPDRAATLVHESRHAGGSHHDSGTNDSSWEYNGAWRWHVCWLAWFAFAGTRTTNAMKTLARQRANVILASNFAKPPGFTV
jgi:hypothetical protein